MKRLIGTGVFCLLAAACAHGPHSAAVGTSGSSVGGRAPVEARPATVDAGRASVDAGRASVEAGRASVEEYVAAIKAASDRSDHESDAKARTELATQATNEADACLALDSKAAGCQYGKAVATGLEARAHPTRAVALLGNMLQSLTNAENADPNYDKAGPARVRALVLIRAPGWPVGPGDADAGLAAALHAVELQPAYPPNVLALAEALAKTGDPSGAHDKYAHARELAQVLPSGQERDDWLHDAEQGLARTRL